MGSIESDADPVAVVIVAPSRAASARRRRHRVADHSASARAYEATGKRIAILGDGGLAQREATFLATYSDDVTVIGTADGAIAFDDAAVRWTRPGGEPPATFDHLYLALGCEPQTDLAIRCGGAQDGDGNLIVDAHQMTSVEGLYAAGDVVRGLNQIAVATGEAAIAATAMHNRLRRETA